MKYLLDTNVFIEAKNTHCDFDVCPGFWEWLLIKNKEGIIFSVQKVKEELITGTDELAQWARNRHGEFFLTPDENVIIAMREISRWTSSREFPERETARFLDNADYFLVAHALAHDFAVVTREKFVNPPTNKIKIPNVCDVFGIDFLSPFELLRREKARFVLDMGEGSLP